MFEQLETISLMLLTITQTILMMLALNIYYDLEGIFIILVCLITGFVISACELTIIHKLVGQKK